MKKALVIINVSKDESMCLAGEIASFLKQQGFSVEFFDFDGFCDNVPFSGYDFVVTLGGDGTVLFAARNCVESGIPLFPVNLGEFGFIASVQPSDWQHSLSEFLAGNAAVMLRSMLAVEVRREGSAVYSSLGLNDVVISARRAATTVLLDIDYEGLRLCRLKGDGVILATPTGSTAYSAAAGGPILDAGLDAFVLTPVNSFSLSSRPLVLNASGAVTIRVGKSRTKEVSVTVDGQEPAEVLPGDVVSVTQFPKKARIICSSKEQFYDALRSKLNWSGGRYA